MALRSFEIVGIVGHDMIDPKARRALSSLVGVLLTVALVVLAAVSIPAVGAAPVRGNALRVSTLRRGEVARRCFGLYPGFGADVSSHVAAVPPSVAGLPVHYPEGCQGHDEAEIAPISAAANTGQEVTWTIVLPVDGTGTDARAVVDEGPTFWFGASVHDRRSLFGQAFEELQFLPDSILTAHGCLSGGGNITNLSANKYTVCAPVWAVNPDTGAEYATFNAMLTTSTGTGPLVMNGGDSVTVHVFKGSQSGTPLNILVSDRTTGEVAKPIVVSSAKDGPLAPVAGANTTSNFIKWGVVDQPPLSFAWEIGHSNGYTYPKSDECVPGMFNCYSYNVTQGWSQITPLVIQNATFAKGIAPSSWAVTDGQGGAAEVTSFCGLYDAPGSNGFCTFPWYSYSAKAGGIEFGGAYSNVTNDYGAQNQYPLTQRCADAAGGFGNYCSTTLNPKPPIP